MTTEAGRRLLVWLRDILTPYVPHGWMDDMGPGLGRHAEEHIAAIEAEARAALLAELEAGVEGLPAQRYSLGLDWAEDSRMVNRAAVLDLIRKAGRDDLAEYRRALEKP